jgi:hypothetical protein
VPAPAPEQELAGLEPGPAELGTNGVPAPDREAVGGRLPAWTPVTVGDVDGRTVGAADAVGVDSGVDAGAFVGLGAGVGAVGAVGLSLATGLGSVAASAVGVTTGASGDVAVGEGCGVGVAARVMPGRATRAAATRATTSLERVLRPEGSSAMSADAFRSLEATRRLNDHKRGDERRPRAVRLLPQLGPQSDAPHRSRAGLSCRRRGSL